MAQIFNDNFETGDFSLWTSEGDYEEVTIETGISGMQGTYCAKFPDDSGGELIKTLAVSKAEVYGALDFKGISASAVMGISCLSRPAGIPSGCSMPIVMASPRSSSS